MNNEQELHYNYPQIRSMLVGAPEEWLVAGRGTGKSEGVLAPKSVNCYLNTMPRGCGVNVGATFTQILTRTLPALVYGWEKMGYVRGMHYLIGEKPTEKWKKMWNWKGPFRPPQKQYDYFISWWNGAGIHLVSQDRPGSSNGVSIDWIIGDEVKLLNREKLVRELFPANRGIIHEFKDNPYHHGKTFTTDMPVGTSGRWIFEKENEMDKQRVNEVLRLKSMVFVLEEQMKNASERKRRQYARFIDTIEKDITVLRRGKVIDSRTDEREARLLYYHEASTLDNIHALGFDYIKEQLRESSEFEFNTQILNKRPIKMEDGFYPDLNEEKHGYFAYNYSFIESIGYDFEKLKNEDCRRDSDLVPELPLHISLDYNRRLFPLIVGQDLEHELRVLKAMDVEYPLKSKDVIDSFCNYYRFHKEKVVYYWYDHTAIGELDATPIATSVMNYLTSKGWVVIPMYIGKSTTHEARYRMYGHLLKEDGTYDKVLRMNRDNCKYLFLSMFQAGAERRKDGFGKDKKPEQDLNFPAREATHYSESLDMWVVGMLESKLSLMRRSESNPMQSM